MSRRYYLHAFVLLAWPFFSRPHRARLVKGQHALATTLRAVRRAGR
jgi:hypothetical protein